MERGEYLNDGAMLLGFAGQYIKEVMSDSEIIQGALFLAIGMEKWLKHCLVLVNPTYVLEKPEFRHSAAVIYKNRLISQSSKDLEKDPTIDVIAFRLTLTRAKVFSKAANSHNNLLYALASWRDIIVHRPTSELPLDQVKRMLQKDAVPLVTSFCEEFGITPPQVFGDKTRGLLELSERLTAEELVAGRVTELLNSHRELWEHRQKNDKGFVAQAEAITRSLLNEESTASSMHDQVKCPACGNPAVVLIEVEYEHSDGESYPAGAYVEHLHCYYCSLRIDDYETLAYIDVDALLST